MSDQPKNEEETREHLANKQTLEIAFLAFIGLVVLWAFVEALSYQLVSSRTPFVIMAPLRSKSHQPRSLCRRVLLYMAPEHAREASSRHVLHRLVNKTCCQRPGAAPARC